MRTHAQRSTLTIVWAYMCICAHVYKHMQPI